jgi:uncharacterized protein YbjT (DUF2867 family)
MDVAIVGGNGQIALRLARALGARGDHVRSLVRKPEHFDDVRAAGGEPVLADLENGSADELAAAISGANAVVFAAGAGPGSGPERKETVDYGGAVELIEAAKAAAITRYVMVSSIGADPDAEGDDFALYLRAKGRADAALVESGLDFTIIRPGRLTDNPGTGKVLLAPEAGYGEVPRDDVAAVLAAVLHADNTIGATLVLVGGDEPLESAVAAV